MTDTDPAHITNRRQFGCALTRLREDAGRTVREVAKAAGVPVATVGDYFSGRTVPPARMAGVLTPVLRACGVVDPLVVASWLAALARVRHTTVEPPYRGGVQFQAAHANWFFGRDDLVRTVTDRLAVRRAAGLPLAVIGGAGTGMSSVLAAGLIPALGGQGFLLTPGDSPCRRLADLLCTATGMPADRVDQMIHCRPHVLASVARDAVQLLVVDNFADVFTSRVDEATRHTFVTALTALSRDGVRVVFGLRAGGPVPELCRQLFDDPVLVDRMSEGQLRAAVESPARLARLSLDADVTDAVLADVAHLAAPLSSLSRVMLSTWHRREGSALTMRSYRAAVESVVGIF